MKFNLTIDKQAEAVIDHKLCINCGKCREICPTKAIEQYQRTVYCMFPDCGEGKGKATAAKYLEEARDFSSKSSCQQACPLGIVPQSVATLVKRGDIEGAYKLIEAKNPMPWICASICDQPCRNICKRGNMFDSPINMRAIENYILSKVNAKQYNHIARYNEKIAVIGGGPAGLAAAFKLSMDGYAVTIFEKDSMPGGTLNWKVPAFRLDKEKLSAEIDRIISAGIEVRCNHDIGENYPIEEIWNEGFSVCLIAAGESFGIKPELPGVNTQMVYDAVSLMQQINAGEDKGMAIGDEIVVIGGDEFSIDVARVLKRMGKNVICTAMNSLENLPVSANSRKALEEEKIEINTLIGPKQIISEDDKVNGVEFIEVNYSQDENGRLRARAIKDSEFTIPCDTVVFAIGQKCSVEKIADIETYPNGRIKIDKNYKTNKEMIFACGGAAGESGSIAETIAEGFAVADEINEILHGTANLIQSDSESDIKIAPDALMIYPDNVQKIRPQFEETIKESGTNDNSDSEFVEDILPILREAGIEEHMPHFAYKDDNGNPKRKVAVIGGGIAGVTAAIDLAKKGYRPTIFEKHSSLGGSYRWMTSSKRLDKDLLKRELKKVETCGIDVVFNVSAGSKPNISELFESGYEAVLFAIGETCGILPELDNTNSRGVFDMLSLMMRLADDEEISGIGQQVLITGYDEMTFDMARTLTAFCSEVTVLSPFGRRKLESKVKHVTAALDAGVNLVTGVEIVDIHAENGILKSVECKVLERNVNIDIPCDTLVVGGMKRPDTYMISLRNNKLDIDENGYIEANKHLITSVYGVFAIGDFDMSSVEAGHAGADAVRSFMQSEEININADKKRDDIDVFGDAFKYELFEGRILENSGFEVGRKIFDDHQAVTESSRCLGCGYHRQIEEKCIGCGVCMTVCPANAIILKSIDSDEAESTEEV